MKQVEIGDNLTLAIVVIAIVAIFITVIICK